MALFFVVAVWAVLGCCTKAAQAIQPGSPLDPGVHSRCRLVCGGATMRTATMTIGEVARRAGVAVDTVRFYEHQGLLEQPARRPSGYREYDEGVVARLRFILR